MTMRVAVLMLGLTFGVGAAQGQMGSAATPKIGPGTMVEPSKSFDAMLTDFEREFMGAAKAMPAEKYSFAPSAADFASGRSADFKEVRTFAQQVTHVTSANYHYAAMAGGLKVDADLKSIGSLTDKDQIVAAAAASFAFAHKAMANLTEKNAFESVHETLTRSSAAGTVVAHGSDHYGQMVEYLRMNGIVPPSSVR